MAYVLPAILSVLDDGLTGGATQAVAIRLVRQPEILLPQELTWDLIAEVNRDPETIKRIPNLVGLFEATPWLLPPGSLTYGDGKGDLFQMAELRSIPKGNYEKAITLAFFSKGMVRMLQNCIYSMVKFGKVDNYIVVTWNAEDYSACLELNLPCAYGSEYLLQTNTPESATNATNAVPEFESKPYNRIMWLKPAVVSALLERGFVVHSTDIDLAYSLKTIWEWYFNLILDAESGAVVADAAFQSEGGGIDNSPINSGNHVALPTERIRSLFKAWLKQAKEKVDVGGNQRGLVELFKTGRFRICATIEECKVVRTLGDVAAAPSSEIMHSEAAPALIRIYNPPWWHLNQNFCAIADVEHPLALDPCHSSLLFVHSVCTPKGGDRVALKTEAMKKVGFWFLDDRECPRTQEELVNYMKNGDLPFSEANNSSTYEINKGVERCVPAEVVKPGSAAESAVLSCQPRK